MRLQLEWLGYGTYCAQIDQVVGASQYAMEEEQARVGFVQEAIVGGHRAQARLLDKHVATRRILSADTASLVHCRGRIGRTRGDTASLTARWLFTE